MQTCAFCVDADQRTPAVEQPDLLASTDRITRVIGDGCWPCCTTDRISRVISDGCWPCCTTRFDAENNETLAQRIGNPLLVGPAGSACTQGRDRLGMAKGHGDAAKLRDAAPPGQR